ncbi:Detected protein of unknown function [Hibiscus syriacus]|uniref:Protein kinase domain-containing protein n=1 Tax=Hibiscus syriacus TaxID=106335 RepID=A0A6A2YI19_HIBSY|nr:Detected protein of unknown function [Hibiscus syriacus]
MASGASLKSCHGKEMVDSSDRGSTDGDTDNICVQTGEEFSTEFLKHTGALRRIAVTMDADYSRSRLAGFNNNQNCHQVYKDLKGIPEFRRKESEYGSNVPNYGLGTGRSCPTEVESYHDHFSRYKWLIGGSDGQNFVQHSEASYIDPLSPWPTVSPLCVVESSQLSHSNSGGFTEGTFVSKMKFLCSFGGRILPRPNDGKLRYVGGETRIISIKKNLTYEELARKTAAICNQPHTIKYQLPGEDLDALISVCSDEDLQHMIEEYHELERNGGYQRLRLFLVSLNEHESPGSFEGRNTPRQHDIDYQYIFAVNGMLDASGQNLASQANQFGNASDYSHSFHTDSPTSAHGFENKDYSPSSPNTSRMFSHPAAKFLTNLQIPSRSFNYSPPLSPGQGKQGNPSKSNLQYVVDTSCFDHSNEGINRYVMETHPGGNSYYMDATSYHNNHPHIPLPFMNHQNHNQHLLESILSNKSRESIFIIVVRVEIVITFDCIIKIPRLLTKPLLWKGHFLTHSYKDMMREMNNRRKIEIASRNSSITDKNLPSASPRAEDLASSADSLNLSTTRDGQCAITKTGSGQSVAHGSPKLQPVRPRKLANQEPTKSGSNLTTDNASSRQAFLHGEEAASRPTTSQQSKVIESAVIIEDVTSNTPADVPSSSAVVPHIQHGTSDETKSTEGSKVEKKSNHKEMKSGGKSADGTIIDAKKVEIEAEIHGLQIIKNADIEELQELGSGTFGTVYYANGEEQMLLLRESKKVAFPAGHRSESDGPEGTMATVTEYMVNGSLRNALLKKDRALDRCRKVILALDAAFGMEYLHSKNIVHFDLKCDNLLINLKDPQRPICKRNTLVSGGVRGTLPWMAPELLNGSSTRVSEKVDVFSFGVAIWEILTGEEPYASMHCGELLAECKQHTETSYTGTMRSGMEKVNGRMLVV